MRKISILPGRNNGARQRLVRFALLTISVLFHPALLFAFEPLSGTRLSNPDSIPFAPAVDYGTGSQPQSVFASDLDGDADVDLAVANGYSNTVSVLKNNGDGTFAAKVDYGTGNGPYSVFASDLDGDKDQDLAVANSFSNTVSILKNLSPCGFPLGDVNQDGVRDIVDIIILINYVFYGEPLPVPPACADLKPNQNVDVVDIVCLINNVFFGGSIPCL